MYTLFFLLIGCFAKRLPTAKDLFDANRNPPKNFTVLHTTGTIASAQAGIKGTLEMWVIKKQGIKILSNIEKIGKSEQGYDMKVGWSIDPMKGPRVLEGKEKKELIKSYENIIKNDPSRMFQNAKVTGKQMIVMGKNKEKKVYHMQAIDKTTKLKTDLFFDVKSKKMIAQYSILRIPQGQLKTKTHFLEYKDFDGWSLITKMEMHVMNTVQSMSFDKYEFDPPNPPKIEIPASVQQVLKEQAEEKKEEDKK